MKRIFLSTIMMVIFAATGAWAATSGYISVANDNGSFYGDAVTGMYYYDFTGGGGGLNQLHMTATSTGTSNANVTYNADSLGSSSGSFWITTTGGKGGNDNLILCMALTGTISNNFALSIISNGYVATPGSTTRPTITSANWQDNVVDEVFYTSDFIYGPVEKRMAQTDQLLYNGQGTATGMLMYIDLGVCNRNGGFADQVLFDIDGLYEGNVLAYSVYAYDLIAGNTGPSDGDFIGWTTPTATNCYSVIGAGAAPVPIPPALLLMGSGLGGIAVLRRKWGMNS